MRRQLFPTAPSPTTTTLILFMALGGQRRESSRQILLNFLNPQLNSDNSDRLYLPQRIYPLENAGQPLVLPLTNTNTTGVLFFWSTLDIVREGHACTPRMRRRHGLRCSHMPQGPWGIVHAFIVSAGTLVATRGSHPSWPCEPQSPKTARTSQYGRRRRLCRVAPSRPRSRRLFKRCRSWRGLGSWRHGAKHKAARAKSPCAPHRQHYAGVMARATACSWIRSEKHGM